MLLSASSKSADVSIVLGVSNEKFDPDQHRGVSLASCTTNSLTPVLKVLNDTFGLESAMVTTILGDPHSGIADGLSMLWFLTGSVIKPFVR